jgi:membrane fusion protein (multidrug efflux system)
MTEQAASNKKKIKVIVSLVLVVAISITVFCYWRYSQIHPSTDDAYLQANVINIVPQVAGKITELAVNNNQQIKKDQLLFVIDPEPYQLAVNKAQAQLVLAQKNAERILSLANAGRAPKAEGDEASAKLAVAKAELAEAELHLRYTRVTAPADGVIANLSLRQGSLVDTQNALFALIETENCWVDANYKENQLTRIRPGQTAEVKIDMYPDLALRGEVESISHGSGAAFSLLPAENATGNWVKVTQRFTVRVKLKPCDARYPLRVGASTIVTIDTTDNVNAKR